MKTRKMNSKINKPEEYSGDWENYTLIDYSMSDVESILENCPLMSENKDSIERNTMFINNWSVPIGGLPVENNYNDYDDLFFSTWEIVVSDE